MRERASGIHKHSPQDVIPHILVLGMNLWVSARNQRNYHHTGTRRRLLFIGVASGFGVPEVGVGQEDWIDNFGRSVCGDGFLFRLFLHLWLPLGPSRLQPNDRAI